MKRQVQPSLRVSNAVRENMSREYLYFNMHSFRFECIVLKIRCMLGLQYRVQGGGAGTTWILMYAWNTA